MLKVKGMSVFPPELEALLGQHPAVLGSGVVAAMTRSAGRSRSHSSSSSPKRKTPRPMTLLLGAERVWPVTRFRKSASWMRCR